MSFTTCHGHSDELTHKKRAIIYANFSYPATKSNVLGTQSNPLDEMIPTSSQNTCQN